MKDLDAICESLAHSLELSDQSSRLGKASDRAAGQYDIVNSGGSSDEAGRQAAGTSGGQQGHDRPRDPVTLLLPMLRMGVRQFRLSSAEADELIEETLARALRDLAGLTPGRHIAEWLLSHMDAAMEEGVGRGQI